MFVCFTEVAKDLIGLHPIHLACGIMLWQCAEFKEHIPAALRWLQVNNQVCILSAQLDVSTS